MRSRASRPQHYCVWLSKANHTYRVSLRARHFAVHFLTAEDFPLAERFGTLSGEDTDKFDGLDVDLDPNGVPLLRACRTGWRSSASRCSTTAETMSASPPG